MADGSEGGRLTTGWKILIIITFLGAAGNGGRQLVEEAKQESEHARTTASRAEARANEAMDALAKMKKRVAALEARLKAAPSLATETAEPK